MYIVVHYPLFASRISGTKGQGCQTISPLWPDVSARQSWRKSQISPSRHKAARMPRCSSSRSPGRQVSRRSRAGRTSSNPGSGAGMTAGTGTRGRAGIPRASTTMSGGIAPRSRNRRSPLNPVGTRRISMQKRTNPGTTVPPSSAGTTGGAGPRRRSSKSGPTISTASNCCLAPSFFTRSRSQSSRSGTSAAFTTRTPIFSMSRTFARCTSSDAAPTASSTSTTG